MVGWMQACTNGWWDRWVDGWMAGWMKSRTCAVFSSSHDSLRFLGLLQLRAFFTHLSHLVLIGNPQVEPVTACERVCPCTDARPRVRVPGFPGSSFPSCVLVQLLQQKPRRCLGEPGGSPPQITEASLSLGVQMLPQTEERARPRSWRLDPTGENPKTTRRGGRV